ncbi:MAG TPA: DNA polymerase ligase N-terminal domain-containing protein [Pirellulales bacterium]|jgi:hypothetical protein|nr:DNA polymerase ligase N-terminal domain-containing protein [Pirellulales bacterium]
MPRYVVLHHEMPAGGRPSHWDLMLEFEGALRTWALTRELSAAQPPVQAEALADHRLEYLSYEGPVSRGRGTVTRWDAGVFEVELDVPAELRVSLGGQRLHGKLALKRDAADGHFWTVSFSAEPTSG